MSSTNLISITQYVRYGVLECHTPKPDANTTLISWSWLKWIPLKEVIFVRSFSETSGCLTVQHSSSSQNKQQKVHETVLYLTTENIKKFPAANLLCLFRFYVLRRLEWTFPPRTHNLDPDYNSDSHDSRTITSRARYNSIMHRNAIILPRKCLNLRGLGTCR